MYLYSTQLQNTENVVLFSQALLFSTFKKLKESTCLTLVNELNHLTRYRQVTCRYFVPLQYLPTLALPTCFTITLFLSGSCMKKSKLKSTSRDLPMGYHIPQNEFFFSMYIVVGVCMCHYVDLFFWPCSIVLIKSPFLLFSKDEVFQ